MIDQTIKIRSPNNFEDVLIERKIEIKRDGVEVDYKSTTWDDILNQYSFLKGYDLKGKEEFINLDGNRVFRAYSEKNGMHFYFYFEKVY